MKLSKEYGLPVDHFDDLDPYTLFLYLGYRPVEDPQDFYRRQLQALR